MMAITRRGRTLVRPHAAIVDHLCILKMIAKRLQSAETVEIPIIPMITNFLLVQPSLVNPQKSY